MEKNRNILLYPLSLVYGAITGVRNFLYNSGVLKGHEFGIPVICVGNITVGGTGKTPHCEYLIGLIRQNYRVALLSRGYKRKKGGFRVVSPDMNPDDVGDEPLQICRKFPGITVAVDRDRVRGVTTILREHPETEVIILDDGFQHRSITPGLSVLLTDFNRLMINDFMLPYGELRESVRNMYRADLILITKSPETISPIQRRIIVKDINKAPYQNLYFTSFKYTKPLSVFPGTKGSVTILSESEKEKTGVVLVTGIANPAPLMEYIRTCAGEIIHLCYRDHHRFTVKDLNKITDAFLRLGTKEKFIITTEKDATRMMDFTNIAESVKSSFWYIPIEVFFLNDDQNEFNNLILEYVRKNKRNNRIS